MPATSATRLLLLLSLSILASAAAFLSLFPFPHPSSAVPPHRKLAGISIGIDQLISIICTHTVFPDACRQELSAFNIPLTASPSDIISFSAKAASSRASNAQNLAASLVGSAASSSQTLDVQAQCADDCADLMSYARDRLDSSMAELANMQSNGLTFLRDVKVWLSEALSYQSACSDGLRLVQGSSTEQAIQGTQEYLAQVIGNVLALVDVLGEAGADNMGPWISGDLPPIPPLIHLRRRRSLLQYGSGFDGKLSQLQKVAGEKRRSGEDTAAAAAAGDLELSFPDWISPTDRKLLQSDQPANSIPINAVVAQDGSPGSYPNVTAAIEAIPEGFQGRFVIYIKAGLYNEVFNISKKLENVTFLGDGMDKTVISGDRNVASGLFNTYRTSTVGILGRGFHARDITFRNVAGAEGHQAVAMRAAADLLVFYRCSFEGFQDTLYALSGRQLYRQCRIYGTVDFIFGNAIAVFQNCELVVRLPLPTQTNTITAQGRKLQADVSGFSFQSCNVYADTDLAAAAASGVNTFLGRPWKEFSRVVFMNTALSGIVNSAGWTPWNESYPFIDTVFYGEFQNYGAGSSTAGRVTWPGVFPAMTPDQASQFSFDNFIAGSTWVSPSAAGFDS